MLVTAATNAEEAYTLLNEIVGIGDFSSADLADFLILICKQVGKKERSIENLTNDLKYGSYDEEDQLELIELLFREQTILKNLTEVITATKENWRFMKPLKTNKHDHGSRFPSALTKNATTKQNRSAWPGCGFVHFIKSKPAVEWVKNLICFAS